MAREIFETDHAKTLRDNPAERLAYALKSMPYPHAFKEAYISYRALIRQRIKEGDSHSKLLAEMYNLMATENFLFATPYIEELRMPGFTVAQTIPKKVLKQLPFPYEVIGYKQLTALNADIKWFVSAWGEPTSHCNCQEYHSVVWQPYVDKFVQKMAVRDAKMVKVIASTKIDKSAIENAARSMVQVLNESLIIANESKNYDTRVSRMRIVKNTLAEIKKLQKIHPGISLVSLDAVMRSIEAVELETRDYAK